MLYVLLIFMVLCWSANFIVAKWTLRELPPFALLFLRVFFSNLLFLALYRGMGRHKARRLPPGEWKWLALLGLLGIAMNQAGFTVGIHYTTVSHSSLIIALTPVFVLVLARLLGLERMTALKAGGMAVSFAGVAILTLEHGKGPQAPTVTGDVITLGGAIGFAFYTVFSKRIAERYDTLSFNTFIYMAALLVVTPVAGWQLFQVAWQQVTWRGWLGTFYMAAAASVTAYMIFYYALSKIDASRVIAFSYLQPVFATLLGILLLGERVTPYLLTGGPLVVIGVYLTEWGRWRARSSRVPGAD